MRRLTYGVVVVMALAMCAGCAGLTSVSPEQVYGAGLIAKGTSEQLYMTAYQAYRVKEVGGTAQPADADLLKKAEEQYAVYYRMMNQDWNALRPASVEELRGRVDVQFMKPPVVEKPVTPQS